MQRLEMIEKVQRLSRHFLELREDAESLITCNNVFYSIGYLEDKIEQYREAFMWCEKFLRSECCKQCLIFKLRSLDLDHYATDLYDYDSDGDSGLEM